MTKSRGLGAVCTVLLLASCGQGADVTGATTPAGGDPAVVVPGDGDGAVVDSVPKETETSLTSVAVSSTPTSTGEAASATTTSTPAVEVGDEKADDDPWYLYAQSGAAAVAAQINEYGVEGLTDDELEMLLIESGEAAYEIEYPSIVVYLDVVVETDPPIVIVTVGDDEDDTRSSSYVCLTGVQAVVAPNPCPTNG